MNKKLLIFAVFFIFIFCFILYGEMTGLLGPRHPASSEAESPAQSSVSSVSSSQCDPQGASQYFKPVEDRNPPNEELELYLPGQVTLDRDSLIMTAALQEDTYLSGKAESIDAFRYGEFSFRIHPPKGKGFFPAVWMMPASGAALPEMDLYENVGSHPRYIYGVMHYADGNQRDKKHFRYSFPKDAVPTSYVIDFSWTPEKLVWKLDGEEIFTIEDNIPDIPMYMIVNLAVGGIWPGAPDEATEFPGKFQVDFLKFEPKETFIR